MGELCSVFMTVGQLARDWYIRLVKMKKTDLVGEFCSVFMTVGQLARDWYIRLVKMKKTDLVGELCSVLLLRTVGQLARD